jgi:von Willebrand factor type A domain
MRNVKAIIWIKICLLVAGMILAWMLLIFPSPKVSHEETTVIIMDMHTGMMIKDIAAAKGDLITRLDAAKQIIDKLVQTYPQHLLGLITYGEDITYLIPPTTDSWNLLQYVDSLLISVNSEQWTVNSGGKEDLKKKESRSTWLLDALAGKNLLVIGNVPLPPSLAIHAKNIWLGTTIHSIRTIDAIVQMINDSDSQTLNISTIQFQRLVVLLCIIIALAL